MRAPYQVRTAACLAFICTQALGAQGNGLRPQNSEMGPLLAAFTAGAAPDMKAILGTWVLIKQVDTEQFLSGRHGPDRLLADEDGVRTKRAPQSLYWVLRVTRDADGKLSAASETPWMDPETSSMSFNSRGEITFSKEYGGDTPYRYHCRVPAPDRLICVWNDRNPGHAVEFRRIKE